MIIVVEGMDNSGKSTLAAELCRHLGWSVQVSGGPPLYAGEISERIVRFNRDLDEVIFDRHPAVSEPIYQQLRPESHTVRASLIGSFYASRPLFIYCDPLERGLLEHVAKVTDTQQHLHQIETGYSRLLAAYRVWAVRHAHIIYRIGDNVDFVLACAKQFTNGRYA